MLKDEFEVTVVSCKNCNGSGEIKTGTETKECPTCKGTGEIETIRRKEKQK